MKTILSIQSQVVGARVGNSVAAFAMERLGVPVSFDGMTTGGMRFTSSLVKPGGGP